MSKLFDALRKAEEERRRGAPAEPVSANVSLGSPLPIRFHTEMGLLKSGVEARLPGRERKVIAVGGSVRGEGSSTVAAHFARFLADDPRERVVAVDLDLREPSLARRLGVAPGPGLDAVLRGEAAPEQTIAATELPNLYLLAGAEKLMNPLKFFTPSSVTPLFRVLRERFAYTVLDLPPVMSCPEAGIAASLADGMVLVIEASQTKRELVQKTIESLVASKVNVLGLVLNKRKYVIPRFLYERT